MSKGKIWFALVVLFAINLLNFYDRIIPSAVGKMIRDDLKLSNTEYGFIGTAFIILYAVVGIPLGLFADRLSRKRILSFGVFFWSVMTAASGLAGTYMQMLFLRLGVGVGEASCAPAANSMIGDLFPAKRRAFALSMFMLGLPIGNAMGTYLSGAIAKHFSEVPVMGHVLSWRAAFFVALIPGLLCAVGTLFMTEPARGATETHSLGARKRSDHPYRPVVWIANLAYSLTPGGLRESLKGVGAGLKSALADIAVVFSIPTMLWLIAAGAFHNFIMYGVGHYLPMEAQQYHGMDVLQGNQLTSWVYGLAGIPGMILGGMLGDLVIRHRKNGRLLVAACALTLAAPAMWYGLNSSATSLLKFEIFFAIGCALLYVYFATVYSSIQDVIEPSLRATAMAVYFCFMYLFGGMLGPVGVGYLSDHFAAVAAEADGIDLNGTREEVYEQLKPYQKESLHEAMYWLAYASGALGIVLFAASYTVSKDAEKMQSWMRSVAASGEPAKPKLEKVAT